MLARGEKRNYHLCVTRSESAGRRAGLTKVDQSRTHRRALPLCAPGNSVAVVLVRRQKYRYERGHLMSSGLAPRPRPWQLLGRGAAGLLGWEAGPAERPPARPDRGGGGEERYA